MHPFEDTIVAPATGPGEYGIGIIRLSGPRAFTALTHIFRAPQPPAWQPRRLYHGYVVDSDGETLDEILAVFFPAPHSYTGEDCVELHCHGGMAVMRRILDEIRLHDIRLAKPGEFTLRAFLNGRLDLTRAEAVCDLIHARSEGARRIAFAQLAGSLFRLVTDYREQLADLLALIEAYVDFPDEELGELDDQRCRATIAALIERFSSLLASYEQGRILRDGAALLILGRPNVGKSSLLNALVGSQRAIVSDRPGTTRDTIEERITLCDLPLQVIDSAGIRASSDLIEHEGVQRALDKLPSADLVLLVFDGNLGFTPEDTAVLSQCADRPVLLVQNKLDLPQASAPAPPAHLPRAMISTRTGQGLATLQQQISNLLVGSEQVPNTALLTDLRHKEALHSALQALHAVQRLHQQQAPYELLACELRACLVALGLITGETTPDDILERIFSRFCIGK